jgi:tetratricopeptide (TPR) repeat protein
MDGRRKRFLACVLLAGAVGCNTTPKQTPPIVQMPPAATPVQTAKSSSTEPHILKPSTNVQFGQLNDQAANEPNLSPSEAESLRQLARQSYQKALNVDPKYVPAYVAMGESFMQSGDRVQSQAMFKKAIELAPKDAGLWSDLGAAQARAKDWPDAIASLSKAVQMDPNNKPLVMRLGYTQARAGQYEDALNTLAKCMNEAEARYNVARMMRHNGQDAAAEQQLALALKADPKCEVARQMLEDRGQSRVAEVTTAGGTVMDSGIQQAGYHTTSPVQLGTSK